MKKIESANNPYFKTLTKILKSAGIKREKLFCVMGAKVVQEVFRERESQIKSILIFDEAQGRKFKNSKKLLLLPKNLFKQIDIFDTQSAILILELPEIPKWSVRPPENLELFVPVQDPSNLGAIVRSAVAFGVEKIILLKECANPYHPKAVKSSSGMVLKMKFESGPSIHDLHLELKEFHSLDMDGQKIETFLWPKNISLVIGEEGQGLPENLRKNSLSISMSNQCESLNVMAATTIALHQRYLKVTR